MVQFKRLNLSDGVPSIPVAAPLVPFQGFVTGTERQMKCIIKIL